MKDNKANENNENYQEYLRLKNDSDYLDVTFDEQSGGISAIHREHKFDKQMGPFGCRRGDYEVVVISALRKNGYRVILESEKSQNNVKNSDGFINDIPMEIKSVESDGVWSISSKMQEAEKQGAQVVILYFPEPTFYSKERLLDGIGKYESNPHIKSGRTITSCLIVQGDQIVDHIKTTTTP